MSGLFEVNSGKIKKPFNVMLVGQPGIGKSTFGASAPAPVFLGADENDEIDANRYPIPESFDDFLKQLNHLYSNPKKYQTVVIDTLDSVEKLVHKKILNSDPKKTGSMMAAHGGYGKAFEKSANEFVAVKDLLKSLRDNKGMHIILLCHAKKVRAIDVVLGLEFDTYETNLHKDAQSIFGDWVSAILYASYVATTKENANSDRVFAMGHGQRIIYTEKRPGHLGKNRYNLPYEMDLDFQQFYDGYSSFYDGAEPAAADLIASIVGMMENISDEKLLAAVSKSVEENKENVTMLKRILARVEERVGV